MKNNKILTVLIIISIIAVVGVLGFLSFQLITDSMQTGSKGTQNQIQNEEHNSIYTNREPTTPTEENPDENQTLIQPILNEITTGDGSSSSSMNTNLAATYYYSQLDETAKIIYDELSKNKENLISGNYTIDYDTKFNTLLNSEGGEEKLNTAFQSAWDAFSYDNVDLFYIDVTKMTLTNEYYSLGGIKTYKVSIGPGNNENYFQEDFKSQADVENMQNYIENIKKQIVEQTSSNDEYNKIARVHNWIIDIASYNEQDTGGRAQHSIYGILYNRRAVCEGYAKTFKYLMDAVGVPCVLVSGTGSRSDGTQESHAWNYVQIDDRWYAIDTTWDDPIIIGGGELTDELKYKYFLKGSDEFLQNHREDGKLSENGMSFKFPTLSTQSYQK